jgi:hypothetical protein
MQELQLKLSSGQVRLNALLRDRDELLSELARLERAKDAGEVLSDLRITHCPACDQPVSTSTQVVGRCFLCHQLMPQEEDNAQLGAVRIQFEHERLTGEMREFEDLISVLQNEVEDLTSSIARANDQVRLIDNELKPVREAVSALVQDEISAIDRSLGEASERQAQLSRIARAFSIEVKIEAEIVELESRIAPIDARLGEAKRAIDFDARAALLEDGINHYLNSINLLRPGVWRHEQVSINLSASGFTVRVGRRKWSAVLGGTDSLYFLMAYNYGLLRLSSLDACHYPGLSIIDVPGEFSGEEVGDKENFIIQPFVELLSQEGYAGAQLIVSGASFAGLANVNRLQLNHVYAAG